MQIFDGWWVWEIPDFIDSTNTMLWQITLFLADSASTGLSAEEEGICEAAQMLLVSDSNTCGTVVALSHKMDKQTSDGKLSGSSFTKNVWPNLVDKQLSLGDARMTSLDPEQ